MPSGVIVIDTRVEYHEHLLARGTVDNEAIPGKHLYLNLHLWSWSDYKDGNVRITEDIGYIVIHTSYYGT